MENEPRKGGFRIEFENGKELYCYPDNTIIFTHEHEPYGDHMFIYTTNDEDEVETGNYVFRAQIGNWDEVMQRLEQRGYTFIPSEDGRLRDHDREAYEEYLYTRKPRELPEFGLTERQERLAQFVAYLLLHEHLSAEDFMGNGDLFI